MNWRIWNQVEETLVEQGVRPILAVIPDNRDESLCIDPPEPTFWERVRGWEARGWAIGVHGYQHRYVSTARGLFGWDDRSEFAGLTYELQEDKLGRSLAIFEAEGVGPAVWVAPNHSFDRTTVAVLRDRGLRVISDGLALYPFRDEAGMVWVPMQTWGFEARPPGVWTVCLHHNTWNAGDVISFRRDLRRFADRVTDLRSVLERYGDRERSWSDRLFVAQRRVRRFVRRSRRRASSPLPSA